MRKKTGKITEVARIFSWTSLGQDKEAVASQLAQQSIAYTLRSFHSPFPMLPSTSLKRHLRQQALCPSKYYHRAYTTGFH